MFGTGGLMAMENEQKQASNQKLDHHRTLRNFVNMIIFHFSFQIEQNCVVGIELGCPCFRNVLCITIIPILHFCNQVNRLQ